MAARFTELLTKLGSTNVLGTSSRALPTPLVYGPSLDDEDDIEFCQLPEFNFDVGDLEVAPDPPEGKDDGGDLWTTYRSNHKKYKERQQERFEQRKADAIKQKETYNKFSSAAIARGGKKVVLGGISRHAKR